MRLTRISFLVSFFLVGLLVLTGCNLLGEDPPQQDVLEEPSKAVVVLVDLSGSAVDFRDLYRDSLKQVVETMYHGDFLLVAWITGASVTEPKIVLKESFPKREVVTDDLPDATFLRRQAEEEAEVAREEEDARLETQKKALQAKLLERALPEGDIRRESDIMGAISLAASAFIANPRDRAVLISLSDMIEDTYGGYDLEQEKLSEQRIGEIIDSEKAAGRLPDLRNVEVHVVAASHLERERFFDVRNFWMQYFAAVGAKLSPENYGSILHFR